MPLNPGTTLANRYRIVKILGAGRTGAVYRAWDTHLNQPCALKEQRAASPEYTLFARQAQLLAQLHHHHLPRTLDYFELDGSGQYLVMELIEGEDLLSMQSHGGRLPIDQLLPWIEQVCQALHMLHSQPTPVYHRDVKPANIIIGDGGQAFLVDIGTTGANSASPLATAIGPALDNPYASPELFGQGAVDARSDVYALGATLYFLLTGQGPLPALPRMAGSVLANPTTLFADIPGALGQVIIRALELLPEGRYHGVLNLWDALLSSQGEQRQPGPTFIVSATGSAQYKSINQALASAPPGAHIRVQPGVYRESLRLDKPVEIIGDGRPEEIVIESLQAECVSMATEHAWLRGMTLRGRAGSNGLKAYAVDIPRGKLVLEDCDITNDSSACVAIHGGEADPILRRCRIHHGSSGGVFVYRGGKGLIEDCHIYANARPGIAIQQGGNPLIRRTRITDGQQSGVYVYDHGLGALEQCEITANALTGVEIKQSGNPTIRNCRITGNRYQAIYIHQDGLGHIENCDLSGNPRGAWKIDSSCVVERQGNRE